MLKQYLVFYLKPIRHYQLFPPPFRQQAVLIYNSIQWGLPTQPKPCDDCKFILILKPEGLLRVLLRSSFLQHLAFYILLSILTFVLLYPDFLDLLQYP